MKHARVPTFFLFASAALAAPAPKEVPVLIVADEVPAMEVLAKQLADRVHAKATIVHSKQQPLPEALPGFRGVLVYFQGALAEPFEKAFLAYAENGGNLVLL